MSRLLLLAALVLPMMGFRINPFLCTSAFIDVCAGPAGEVVGVQWIEPDLSPSSAPSIAVVSIEGPGGSIERYITGGDPDCAPFTPSDDVAIDLFDVIQRILAARHTAHVTPYYKSVFFLAPKPAKRCLRAVTWAKSERTLVDIGQAGPGIIRVPSLSSTPPSCPSGQVCTGEPGRAVAVQRVATNFVFGSPSHDLQDEGDGRLWVKPLRGRDAFRYHFGLGCTGPGGPCTACPSLRPGLRVLAENASMNRFHRFVTPLFSQEEDFLFAPTFCLDGLVLARSLSLLGQLEPSFLGTSLLPNPSLQSCGLAQTCEGAPGTILAVQWTNLNHPSIPVQGRLWIKPLDRSLTRAGYVFGRAAGGCPELGEETAEMIRTLLGRNTRVATPVFRRDSNGTPADLNDDNACLLALTGIRGGSDVDKIESLPLP